MLLPYVLYLCWMLSPHLGVLRAGSQVFALLMLFLCVIFLHTLSSGKRLQLLCIFPFNMLCLSAISMMFVEYVDATISTYH